MTVGCFFSFIQVVVIRRVECLFVCVCVCVCVCVDFCFLFSFFYLAIPPACLLLFCNVLSCVVFVVLVMKGECKKEKKLKGRKCIRVCLSVCVSACLSVCLSVCVCVRLLRIIARWL